MNLSLLKKMLPGLVPLLIFILADEIWGTMVGLYVALGYRDIEFLFYYIKDKIIDRFILLDTALLIVLGAISIAFDNDLFFKIKPALIEAILLAVIAFSLWGPRNILMEMSKRYMGEMQLDSIQEKSMRINMLADLLDNSLTCYSGPVISLVYVKRGLVFYQRRTYIIYFSDCILYS